MGEGTTDEVSADVVSTYLKNELSAASKRKQVEVEAEAGLTKQIAALKAKTQEAQKAKLAEIESLDEQCGSIRAVAIGVRHSIEHVESQVERGVIEQDASEAEDT